MKYLFFTMFLGMFCRCVDDDVITYHKDRYSFQPVQDEFVTFLTRYALAWHSADKVLVDSESSDSDQELDASTKMSNNFLTYLRNPHSNYLCGLVVPCMVYRVVGSVDEQQARMFIHNAYGNRRYMQHSLPNNSKIEARFLGFQHVGRVYTLDELFAQD